EAGSTMIETDLAVTADDEIVLIHDSTVDRTTDGTGSVEEKTLREIKALDAGSWKGPMFRGERIPTLREALELVNGRATLVLEIKPRNRPIKWVRRMLDLTFDTLGSRQAVEGIVFSSIEPRALVEVLRTAP